MVWTLAGHHFPAVLSKKPGGCSPSLQPSKACIADASWRVLGGAESFRSPILFLRGRSYLHREVKMSPAPR